MSSKRAQQTPRATQEHRNPAIARLWRRATHLGLCCPLHAFNTDDGEHPEWPCPCSHCGPSRRADMPAQRGQSILPAILTAGVLAVTLSFFLLQHQAFFSQIVDLTARLLGE